jgi:DNA polymerase-3 subunit alpha
MTQYEMHAVESLGLLKFDFLGLSNLTILRQAVELIESNRGTTIDLERIPLDDAKTFELLSSGETTGIFQLESPGMRRYVKELRPTSVHDLAAMVALFRPGPMDNIPAYIRRKHGQEPVTYLHPLLEPYLKKTYGVFVYQEDIMAAAQALGGFTGPEADTLGYAIRKKKSSVLRAQKEKFVTQAAQRGVAPAVIDQVFAAFQPFERYGFNKAHATCYGLIAYQTAYLKANYPVEYMTSVLNAFRDNTEKVGGAIAECRRLGIEVLPPDVHRSGTLFAVEGDAIRFGLLAVRNVGQGAIEAIIAAREGAGAFRSLADFCSRVDLRLTNRRVLESLIRVGALNELGHPAQLLDALDDAMAAGQTAQRDRLSGQVSLFELGGEAGDLERPLPNVSEVPLKERLRWEKELLGLYLSDHPLGDMAEELAGFVTTYSGDFGEELDQQRVVVGGVIVGVRPVITKARQAMAVATLEDLQGAIEVVVFPKVLEVTRAEWVDEAIVLVGGRVDHKGDATVLLAEWVLPWDEARARGPAAVAALQNANGRGRRHEGNGRPYGRPSAGPDAVTIVPREARPPAAVRISPLREEEDDETVDEAPLGPTVAAATTEQDEPPLPDDVARALPTAPSAPTSPLDASPAARLHVRFAAFGQDRLVPVFEEVARALRGRPGETPVVLHIPVGSGQEETMEARYRVAYDPELVAEIGRRVDPGLVRLELAEG